VCRADLHDGPLEHIHLPVLEAAPDYALAAGHAPLAVHVGLEAVGVPVASLVLLGAVGVRGAVIVGVVGGERLPVVVVDERIS